jgi:hypothetical protein
MTVTAEALLSMFRPWPASPSSGNAGSIQLAGNASVAGQDTLVFTSNFGRLTISSFAPATDTTEISKPGFPNVGALLAATHDDSDGNAVPTDAAHGTITIQNVTTAQLQPHQSDFISCKASWNIAGEVPSSISDLWI